MSSLDGQVPLKHMIQKSSLRSITACNALKLTLMP